MVKAHVILCSGLLFAMSAHAAPPVVYHSPNDDGASGGIPSVVPTATPLTLHLYFDGGSSPSPVDVCHQGAGDEVCQFVIRFSSASMDLQAFTPSDPDVLFNLTVAQLDLTGGSFQIGDLGPTKLGDLEILGLAEGGSFDIQLGDFVTSALTQEVSPPTSIVTLPEPGGASPLLLGAICIAVLDVRRRKRRVLPHRRPE